MLSKIQHWIRSVFLLEARSLFSGLHSHFIVGAIEAVSQEADTTAAGVASEERSHLRMQMLLFLLSYKEADEAFGEATADPTGKIEAMKLVKWLKLVKLLKL